ncbi:caspase family protein [Synechocystis sp. LKSZ1]|uniref:caspase family protein n=1 Tax=Synechocystis sp. LKSZ1 TaxID=3144951 RepID=UPI00336BFAB4
MSLNRRTFLKCGFGLGASSLAWGTLPWQGWADSFQATAATAPRKLALLVGINQYAKPATGNNLLPDLGGCATDVALYRDLLVERYGFQPTDVLSLVDSQATLADLKTAFQEHLIQPARAGDWIVVHFSGYGTWLPQPASLTMPEPVLLTAEAGESTTSLVGLAWSELWSLVQGLATDKVTLILDSSFSPRSTSLSGNLQSRSAPLEGIVPAPTLPDLKKNLKNRWVLWATQADGEAFELRGNGFQCGMFSEALTQYLWQAATPQRLQVALAHTADSLVPRLGNQQQPQGSGNPSGTWGDTTLAGPFLGADGFVQESLDEQTLLLSLRGLAPDLLNCSRLNSQFQVQTADSTLPLIVKITEHNGFQAKAVIQGSLVAIPQPGQGIQEKVRAVPRHPSLTLALGHQLDRIERVDATSALTAVTTVTQVVNAGEQMADCVLEKSSDDGYILLTEGGQTLGKLKAKESEAIKSAIGRLNPVFERLLALKWLRLLINDGATTLGLRASLGSLEGQRLRWWQQRETVHSQRTAPLVTTFLPQIARDIPLQLQLDNLSNLDLYYQILGLGSQGQMIAWYETPTPLMAYQNQIAPKLHRLPSGKTSGLNQWFVVAAPASFGVVQSLFANWAPTPGQFVDIPQPLTLIRALLEALQAPALASDGENYYLALTDWVTLPLLYQIAGEG